MSKFAKYKVTIGNTIYHCLIIKIPARRLFNAKDGSSYLYNLFVSNKYKFSARQYNEIYHYIQEKRLEEEKISRFN